MKIGWLIIDNMSNNKGIIYLVQPTELIGTSRYKIGCSAKNDLERCKTGY